MKEMKTGAGFVTAIITAVLAAAGLFMYCQNAGTAFFSNLGKEPVVIGCCAGAIAALLLWMLLGKQAPSWTDLLAVCAPVLLIVSFAVLVNSRINGIASIMTFTNNAQNMADLRSAIIAIALLAAAAVFAVINAFLDVRKAV